MCDDEPTYRQLLEEKYELLAQKRALISRIKALETKHGAGSETPTKPPSADIVWETRPRTADPAKLGIESIFFVDEFEQAKEESKKRQKFMISRLAHMVGMPDDERDGHLAGIDKETDDFFEEESRKMTTQLNEAMDAWPLNRRKATPSDSDSVDSDGFVKDNIDKDREYIETHCADLGESFDAED